ncbi:MAG: Na+/H+ antiporter NhaC family protein [Myxococcota bacterium]
MGIWDAAHSLGIETSGYSLFFSALGYRFYCVFALVLVFMNAYTGRDFGPMLTAERRALGLGQVSRPGSSRFQTTRPTRHIGRIFRGGTMRHCPSVLFWAPLWW